jgi:peptide/nickel transport system substrate-binding protein
MTPTAARPGRMNRREALRLIGFVSGLALLDACAPAAPSTAPTAAVPASGAPTSAGVAKPATDQPKRGGTLRVAMAEPNPLDGHVISPNVFDSIWMAYDTLTAYDDQLKPQPMLAESWDVSSDSKQVTLSLRKGVQFHNGRELTSEDIIWNLQRVRDPKTGVAQLANQSNWFSSMEAPDKYTVVLRSDQPRPAMFDFFEYFNIIGKDAIDAQDPKVRLIGTGPFVIADYAQGDHLTFKRNPSYWQSGKPYLDEVNITFGSDPQSTIVKLEAGALDLVGNPAARDAARLKQDSNFKVAASQISGQYHLLPMNCLLAPTDNKIVRQALNYAVDRQRLVDTVLQKTTGEPRDLPWPTMSPAAEPAKNNVFTFDLDKAKSLLSEAGASSLDLEMVYVGSDPVPSGFGQIYQADLAKIGVKLTLKPLESAAWQDTVNTQKYRGLTMSSSAYANIEPSSLFTLSRHWNYSGMNTTGFKHDTYTQLVTSAQVEPDAAKRKQLYSQINDFLLDQCFVNVLAPNAPTVVTRANVNGLRWTIHESRVYADIWLS